MVQHLLAASTTSLVKGMSIENFQLPEVRCFHSWRSHNEIPVWWQVNLQHLNLPLPETKGLVI